MNELHNISHVYKGLLERNRAFAAFRDEELVLIYSDLSRYLNEKDEILDPMSGYGGSMSFFGKRGFKTTNIELNPPSYYWQILINPLNTLTVANVVEKIISKKEHLPKIKESFSLIDNLFSDSAIIHIEKLYDFILSNSNNNELISTAIILPFVSRFANYVKSSTNITHFKQGGFCSYIDWEIDFESYLNVLKNKLLKDYNLYLQREHYNILADMQQVSLDERYSFFVTSPPYPNYRDYSKLFKIENYVLESIIKKKSTDFNMMIGSNNVSGKTFGNIRSEKANKFLIELLEKAEKLKAKNKKSYSDIKTYYHPYFAQYFYNIQEAYNKLDTMLQNNAVGYIVVNDNITRDIIVPVGAAICDIFNDLGYSTEDFNNSQISHYGNIGKNAKRINSLHTRHILKVWRSK